MPHGEHIKEAFLLASSLAVKRLLILWSRMDKMRVYTPYYVA